MIRNAASQAIVAFLGILEPKNWPECLQYLFNMLESPVLEQQEVRLYIPLHSASLPTRWIAFGYHRDEPNLRICERF